MDTHQNHPVEQRLVHLPRALYNHKKEFRYQAKNFDYVIYKLDRPSKGCTWSYIGLYYYEPPDDLDHVLQWNAAGFATLRDYENFANKAALSGKGSNEPGQVPLCDMPNYGGDPTLEVHY